MPGFASPISHYPWQVAPYVTWSISPFVHLRLEYNHRDGYNIPGDHDHRVDIFTLQLVFAAGPHKHERY